MMTWVSERSGMASSGRWRMDHHPMMDAAVTTRMTMSLLFAEKSMIRLIMFLHTGGRVVLLVLPLRNGLPFGGSGGLRTGLGAGWPRQWHFSRWVGRCRIAPRLPGECVA